MYFVISDWNSTIKELVSVAFCVFIQLPESLFKLLPTQSFSVVAAYLTASL